jgi:hypothetical protein
MSKVRKLKESAETVNTDAPEVTPPTAPESDQVKTPQQIPGFFVEKGLWEAILAYLGSQPHNQVANIIAAIPARTGPATATSNAGGASN